METKLFFILAVAVTCYIINSKKKTRMHTFKVPSNLRTSTVEGRSKNSLNY